MHVTTLAVLLATIVASTGAPMTAVASTRTAERELVFAPGVKPQGPLALDVAAATGRIGEPLRIDVAVRALRDLRAIWLSYEPDGIALAGLGYDRIGDLAAGRAAPARLVLRPDTAGRSLVRIVAHGSTVGGSSADRVALVSVLATPEGVFTGSAGFAALEMRHADELRRRGAITTDEHRRAVARAVVSGVDARGSGGAAAFANVTIGGTVRWADSAGAMHPARLVEVQILDKTAPAETVLATVSTDANGLYTWTGDNARLTGDPRQFAVRARAKNPAGYAAPVGNNTPYGIEVAVGALAANKTVDVKADKPKTDDSHAAFSVIDSFITSQAYVKQVQGTAPAAIRVNFPVAGAVSFYCPPGAPAASCQANTLNILQLDRFDWDVLHHEYGHYVSQTYTIAPSPGGSHILTENLADHATAGGGTYGKDKGVKLAWGEGWPTYFGTSLQAVMGTAALAVPKVGDTHYTDTEDYTPALDYDLESQTGGASAGEDNELSDQRILWDIYDATDDAGDQVTWGHKKVWSALVSAKAKHISDAWNAFIKGKAQVDIEVVRLGCIFTEQKVAPKPTAPADKINAPDEDHPPEFKWDSQGGGPNFRNNKFFVEFYDATFQKKLFTSPQVDTAKTDNTGSWTPTKPQWKQILKAGTPVINWVVKGTQTNAPSTGQYVGCHRRFIVPKTDLVFTIDVTGSMYDDIDAVKAAATDLVNAIDFAAQDWRVAVVSYRDFPVSPYGDGGDWTFQAVLPFSTNKAAIVGAINSLVVGGGADWPESVYTALVKTYDASALGGWREGVRKSVILMGDAPGHDPEPFTGYTLGSVILAALLADPIQIYSVVITGDYEAERVFRELAEKTGGAFFTAANAGQVVGALRDAITASTAAPVADAGPIYYTGRAGVPVQFDAGVSYDVDGTIVSYGWDWNADGVYDETTTSPLVYHTWTEPGGYQMRLRVTDDSGNASYDFADVTIALPDETPPASEPTVAPGISATPVSVSYSASDPAGSDGAEPTGVTSVQLWYRYAPVVSETVPQDPPAIPDSVFTEWQLYDVAFGAPFSFDPPLGSGVYELYTQAVDRADNVEPPPEDADVRLACGNPARACAVVALLVGTATD